MPRITLAVNTTNLAGFARDVVVAAINSPSFHIDPNVSLEQLGSALGTMYVTAFKEITNAEV